MGPYTSLKLYLMYVEMLYGSAMADLTREMFEALFPNFNQERTLSA